MLRCVTPAAAANTRRFAGQDGMQAVQAVQAVQAAQAVQQSPSFAHAVSGMSHSTLPDNLSVAERIARADAERFAKIATAA
eukprot:SAG31_NODE_33459_length_343_cov_1.459016_1_plen_80_part_10